MKLKDIIGDGSESDAPRTKRARLHQGWWRAFVLKQDPGKHSTNKDATICNKLPDESAGTKNFITKEIGELAEHAADVHKGSSNSPGIIEVGRLKTNLLSSQPLCFNFFGLLALDRELGLQTVKAFFPEVTGFMGVKFEYAGTPKEKYTNDNSAFDVALEVSIGDLRGLIGIECKYTEPFSPKEYRSERYREIYESSNNFSAGYDELTSSRFNQLFRNQLIAESLVRSGDYQFVKTALFCSPDDLEAKKTGAEFGAMTRSGLKVIDFFEYIVAIQKLDIDALTRKNTMMLWARYMAMELSQEASLEY